MTYLTVTAKGQVTLRKDVLEHLGVAPGDQIDVEKLPDGRIQVSAAPVGEISAVFGMLKQQGGPKLSIEEIGEITRQGWAAASEKSQAAKKK